MKKAILIIIVASGGLLMTFASFSQSKEPVCPPGFYYCKPYCCVVE